MAQQTNPSRDSWMARGNEIERLRAECDALRAALERSVIALDDWLSVYAADQCDPSHVLRAHIRINERGTLAYIAGVQKQNHAALAAPRKEGERG